MSASYARLAGVYDDFVVDPCHADWAQFLDRVWADDDVHRVLDVCCGTGLMTVELARRDLDVVGVDASPEMLERARRLLGPKVPLVEAVLPDLPVAGPFDAAVSTLDGLNYLPQAEFRAAVAVIADRLRPGGWFVFDVHTTGALDLLRENPILEGGHDGTHFALISSVDDAARSCRTVIELTAPDPADSFTEEHVQYVHTDAEVRAALADAGFQLVSVTDEYTDSPVGDGSLRATWVARRSP